MNYTEFIIVAAIAIFFIALWLDARAKGDAQQYKSALDEKINFLRNSMDGALARISKLEGSLNVVNEKPENGQEETASSEPALSMDAVCAALRYNGFSPEIRNESEPHVVNFNINDTSFRIDTSHLPLLNLELGYSLDPAEEDAELMRRAAAGITAAIFIGKVSVYGDAQAVVFSAEWLCDSYSQLCDRFNKYLEIVCEAHKRFFENYNNMREEKRKAEEDLASRPFPMSEGNNAGTKNFS